MTSHRYTKWQYARAYLVLAILVIATVMGN